MAAKRGALTVFELPGYVVSGLSFLTTLFVFIIGLIVAGVLVTFVMDIAQTKDAIRRNYPVIGHFRYIFTTLGEFFRQYFFAMDREELPFNRAERGWVYRAAKNIDNTIAFGSTKNLTPVGSTIFVNCPFPTLETDAAPTAPLLIGPYCERPFEAKSIFNISGMSFGALSVPAVRALSKGAKMAGCWIGWLESLCKEIHQRGIQSAPDFITVDSGDGGSGAAPMPLMDNVGLLIRESLPMVDDILIKYDLNQRVRLIASGKLITPADVAWALCTGADFVNSARGFMFSLGCIQALKCNKNTCPTGVTTHDRRLQRGLDPEDKAVRVASYCKNMVHEVEVIAHSCGVHEPRQLRRYHVRIVQDSGKSIPMDALYPYPVPVERHGAAKAALLPDLVPGQA